MEKKTVSIININPSACYLVKNKNNEQTGIFPHIPSARSSVLRMSHSVQPNGNKDREPWSTDHHGRSDCISNILHHQRLHR